MTKIHAKCPLCGAKLLTMDTGEGGVLSARKHGRCALKNEGGARRITESRRYLNPSAFHRRGGTAPLLPLSFRAIAERTGCLQRSRCGARFPMALILVADAIVKYRNGAWHTWFFMFVRAVKGEDAIILPPYYAPGRGVQRMESRLKQYPLMRSIECERWASGLVSHCDRLVRTEVSHSSHYGNSGRRSRWAMSRKKRGEDYMLDHLSLLIKQKERDAGARSY